MNIINNVLGRLNPNISTLLNGASIISPIRTTSVSICTFLAYLVISITAIEKNRGNIIPTEASALTLLLFISNSIPKVVSTPKIVAPRIRNGLVISLAIKYAKTIPSNTECDIASDTIESFLRTKNTPSILQAREVIIRIYKDSIISPPLSLFQLY